MKNNYIHVCFIIDCSGSMCASASDVEGGFKRIIEEQKENVKNTGGSCAISLYTFETKTHKIFMGKDVNNVKPFVFKTGGLTAMNDGIGRAIDEIGTWLNNTSESERPEKNLIVIITDGAENNSSEYSLSDVKEKIKHQTEKYSWEFMYLGTDITSTKDADELGIKYKAYNTRGSLGNSINAINTITSCYLNTTGDFNTKSNLLKSSLDSTSKDLNNLYKDETGLDMNENDQDLG